MKVKELIKKLERLDGEKEIFFYGDGNYLQEDNTRFREVDSFDFYNVREGYYLKSKSGKIFVEEDFGGDFKKIKKNKKESIKIAKKYLRKEGYGTIKEEGVCYEMLIY